MIPVNQPRFIGNEKKYLNECIDTGWISSEGPFVERFEEKMCELTGQEFGVAVTNGTDALELAVRSLGLGEGDEVILPTFSIISCAQALVQNGVKPVLVDVDPKTWNMNMDRVEQKITKRTAAIMVVHTYGLPADMDRVISMADRHDLFIIEDAAEAHGLEYKGDPCGGFGDVSIFSFYPNKHITTGEGGMVLTHDEEINKRLRYYRNLCFQRERRFVHEDLGYNMRMTNLQAALGLAQAEVLGQTVERKREVGLRYYNELKDLHQFDVQLPRTDYAENIWWVFGLVLNKGGKDDARRMTKWLGDQGIGTRPFFWPVHEQPVFKRMGLFGNENYPVSEKLARNGFYIPSGTGLSDEDQSKVIELVKRLK